MTEHEQHKIQQALDCLQRAQHLVDDAAQHLCSVNGFAREWSDLATTHEHVKRAWYMVEHRRVELQRPTPAA